MNKKIISSEHDRDVVKVLKCVVPDQTMRLEDTENRVWRSECIDNGDGLAITRIYRNEILVAKIVYDYETGEEVEFLTERD